METKTDLAQDRLAVGRWLQKKPLDHTARRVPTTDSLTEPVQTLLTQALTSEEQIQWMIELPSQGILHHPRQVRLFWNIGQMWELTPSWLIVLTNQRLLLLRTISDGKNPRITAIPVADILYLEHGMILLFSWLAVHWIENDTARGETLYFNSVSEGVFLPFIQMLRRAIAGRNSLNVSDESAPFENASGWADEGQFGDWQDRKLLERLPLKFLNMIQRYALLNDEHICQAVYRPAQWRCLLALVRVMTAPRMVVLGTEVFLLLAAEDLSLIEGGYGLILTFLPLKFVQAVRTSRNGEQCCLNIQMKAQKTVRDWSFSFPLEMEEAVQNFAGQLSGDRNSQDG